MFKLFKNFSKKDIFYIILCILFIVVQVWLDLKLPDYMSEITVLVQSEDSTLNDILIQGLYMLGCAFGSLISAVIVGYFSSMIAADFSLDLRKQIFRRVEDFGTVESFNRWLCCCFIIHYRFTNDYSYAKIPNSTEIN